MIRPVLALLLGTLPLSAKTDKYRLVWRDDPTTTICVQWCQQGGENAKVFYSETDHGQNPASYEKSRPADRVQEYQEMVHHFARITDLKPDTAYYFLIQDSDGASERMWFRTAPAERKPFTFVAGGDCRNNPEPRHKCNQIVPLLRPLFVAFAGDYTDRCAPAQWKEFFDDWAFTKAADGRMFPLLPARGNHEKSNAEMYNLFDVPHRDNYYALTFGGDLLRFYTLNSETSTGGDQAKWLEQDLAKNYQTVRHLVTAYHKPMRPVVTEKSEGTQVYRSWAHLFYRYGVDLSVESDSHAIKRTKPVRPSSEPNAEEGFVADPLGTVFIGEGCWGAPLRPANDLKSWTSDGGSFNGFDWVHVHPDRMEVMTVQADPSKLGPPNSDAASFATPAGIVLWDAPNSGKVLKIPYRAPRPAENVAVDAAKAEPAQGHVLLKRESTWRYFDAKELPSPTWFSPAYSDSTWASGQAPLGYGDKLVETTLDYGKDRQKKRITAWFRSSFDCPDPSKFGSVKGLLLRDDGARLYLNGREILNDNLPAGPVTADTLAPNRTPDDNNRAWVQFSIPANLLKPGENQIAAEIHQVKPNSEDLIFDLQLIGLPAKTESGAR